MLLWAITLSLTTGSSKLVEVPRSFYYAFISCKFFTFTLSDLARYLWFQLKSHAYLYEEMAVEEEEAATEIATIPPWWAVGL